MKIKWSVDHSDCETLIGDYNGERFCYNYPNYPICMLWAKFRIWLRFKILFL